MAYRYTGQSQMFTFEGKTYVHPDYYKKMPQYEKDSMNVVGTYDKPIAGMTQQIAAHLIEQSNLHAFEYQGEDLAEKLTTPDAPLQSTSTTNPSGSTSTDKKDK